MSQTQFATAASSPFEPVFRALPGLYLLLSSDLIILNATEKYARAAFFDIDKAIGSHIYDTFPDNPDESNQKARHDLENSLRHVLLHKEPHTMPVIRFDVPLPAERGGGFEERYWHTTHTPLLNDEGEIRFILHETKDITEQVKSDRNSKRLDLLYIALNAVAWEYDMVQNRMHWGAGLQEMFGYSPEEMGAGGESWNERVHPDDFAIVQASIAKATSSGESTWAGEYRFRKADNTYAYVLDQAHIIYDDNGRPIISLGSIIDLSKRKRTEQDLQESNQRFQHLIEILPHMAWTASPTGKILHFNQNWYAYTGMAQGQTEGWITRVHPEDSAEVLTSYHHAISTGETFEAEYRLRDHLSGTYRWFLERAVPMHDADGKITLWMGTFTDIEEQKQALRQLQQKDEQLQNILRLSPAHLCLLSGPSHLCTYVTPGLYEVYGNRHYLGRPARDIWPELLPLGFAELLDQVYREGDTVQINEFQVAYQKSGKPQESFYNFKYQPLLEESEVTGILISAVEVTELVEAKRKAEALAAALRRP